MSKISEILVLIGGLNWGLVGITNFFGTEFNLVDWIFIDLINVEFLANLVYVLVGLAALSMLYNMMR